MESLSNLDIAVRLAAAMVLGALVGLERERKHRPAGFRTLILVSMGSAAFMILGREAIALPGASPGPAQSADLTRVLQGLIGGIGFIGAGAVLHGRQSVHGLTTAAGIWVTAAIGAASGLGALGVALTLTVGTVFTLFVLDRLQVFVTGDQTATPTPPSQPKDEHPAGD
ncbi:MAG: MgtC/SapB family protein [Phycisphaerales bacterium]